MQAVLMVNSGFHNVIEHDMVSCSYFKPSIVLFKNELEYGNNKKLYLGLAHNCSLILANNQ